jgi:hypothetical protein
MSPRPIAFLGSALLSASLVLTPFSEALAGGMGGYGGGYGDVHSGPHCKNMGVNIYKPVNVFKPVVINKNIDIFKPVIINKNIDLSKNININKNVNINKNIIINKSSAVASAEAAAAAAAQSNSGAAANVVVYGGGGSYESVTVNNHYGEGGQVSVEAQARCEMQEATVVKAIHAVCIAEGHEFAASHMVGETFIDSSYEGEVARCIPGAHLKVIIGDVLQSDQGMAGTYENGAVLECAEHEALRHFKDGMLKCAPAVEVPDCTERTNLRRYGTGDLFFSYRSRVCVTTRTVERQRNLELTGMTMEGGVGDSAN